MNVEHPHHLNLPRQIWSKVTAWVMFWWNAPSPLNINLFSPFRFNSLWSIHLTLRTSRQAKFTNAIRNTIRKVEKVNFGKIFFICNVKDNLIIKANIAPIKVLTHKQGIVPTTTCIMHIRLNEVNNISLL